MNPKGGPAGRARIVVDADFAIGAIDPRLFGSFVEHLGRCVYGGIFEPDHPDVDEHGFRRDVLALTRELGVTIVRYPGGNFVSGYDWEDGVGPVDKRPARLDLAWRSTETNRVGVDEFMHWCKAAGVAPMLAVNLGTRGPLEAARFVEYCNHAGASALADRRRANGARDPHDVRFWCLGNEMDGPWQTGQKQPAEYGRLAKETAKAMRAVDPRLELAACGSSGRELATFGVWEYETLDACFEEVDYISIHAYFRDAANDIADFLTNIDRMDAYIGEVAAIADAVAAKRRSGKRIMLSFDEWNVWYKARSPAHQRQPGWPVAPRLLEEVYDMQDALVVGGALITLLNRCDRVKAACLAQLVNVIAPIMTEPGGAAWRQTIFHPFAQAAKARGDVLRAKIEAPVFSAGAQLDAPGLLASIVRAPDGDGLRIHALNRLPQPLRCALERRGFTGAWRVVEATTLHHPDRHATNTRDAPDRVAPRALAARIDETGALCVDLPPFSWTTIELAREG